MWVIVDPSVGTEAAVASFAAATVSEAAAIFTLVAVISAAVAVGAVVGVLWIRHRRPSATDPEVPVDIESAGILAVAYVTQKHVQRCVPASIVGLACAGALAIIDDRVMDDPTSVTAYDERVSLELVAGPPEVAAGVGLRHGEALILRALFDPDATTGTRVTAVRTGVVADRLDVAVREGLGLAQRRYGNAGWTPRLITTAVSAAIVGVFAWAVAVALGGWLGGAVLVAIFGIVVLAYATLFSERAISFDAAGRELLQNARIAETHLAQQSFVTVAGGEWVLPWAVLFERYAVVERFANVAERTDKVPEWYRSSAEQPSAARFVSCLETLRASMSTRPGNDVVGVSMS